MIKIVKAETEAHFDLARKLFIEYADSLDFDLEFQDFNDELKSISTIFKPPNGVIFLAYRDDILTGTVAMRRLGEITCEMKRLYVMPQHRGLGIGRHLAYKIIEYARDNGYVAMRLDTMDSMTKAISLYNSLGFDEIEAYRYNPHQGARFFELEL